MKNSLTRNIFYKNIILFIHVLLLLYTYVLVLVLKLNEKYIFLTIIRKPFYLNNYIFLTVGMDSLKNYILLRIRPKPFI